MLNHLKQYDNKKLAEFWCYFNVYKYPPELDQFKPINWDLLPIQIKHSINKLFIDYITNRVSEKELLREWNKERMNDIEFDIWWENRKPISDWDKKFLEEIYKIVNSNLN